MAAIYRPTKEASGSRSWRSLAKVGGRVMPSADLDLQAIRLELEARRDSTRTRIAALSKRPERGSTLGFGKRIGDGTTEAVNRLTDIGVGQSLEQTLARTERALTKLDEGTYGICDQCGEAISPGRMRALPEGVLCLNCASKTPRPRPQGRR
jgi:DnaK suppressor protein